jgi:hypothetical protein
VLTALADATGDAITLVAEHELRDLHAIERACPRGEHSGPTSAAAAPQRSFSTLARKRLPSRGVRRRSLI